MLVNIQKDSGSWQGPFDTSTICIRLDNGNEVRISEADSGVLSLENISEDAPLGDLGLMITPQNYSTVHIIPEG